MTQLEAARRGIIIEEISFVALSEDSIQSPFAARWPAAAWVIPANVHHLKNVSNQWASVSPGCARSTQHRQLCEHHRPSNDQE